MDYISKAKFSVSKPKGKEDLYGYGLIKSGPDHRCVTDKICEDLVFFSGHKAQQLFGWQKDMGRGRSSP